MKQQQIFDFYFYILYFTLYYLILSCIKYSVHTKFIIRFLFYNTNIICFQFEINIEKHGCKIHKEIEKRIDYEWHYSHFTLKILMLSKIKTEELIVTN